MKRIVSLVGAGFVLACGPRAASAPAPSDPSAAVTAFLGAVKANDLPAMGRLWGSASRGPAGKWMEPEELRKRLTVIQSFLAHERFSLEPSNDPTATADRPIYHVRLTRKGCEPVVPLTVARYEGGWLVTDVDLGSAGNPARTCK